MAVSGQHSAEERPAPSTGLQQRAAEHVPSLVRAVVGRVLRDVPHYRQLPADEIDVEVNEIVRFNLALFVRMLHEGRLPSIEDLAVLRQAASRRAEEGIPLSVVLAANYAGARACWEKVADLAGPDEAADVVEIGCRVLDYLLLLTTAVAEAHVDTTTLIVEGREARERLLDEVSANRETPRLWEQAGLSPWEERTVLALRLTPPSHDSEPTNAVECRRRNRVVRECLSRLVDEPVIDSLRATGGVVLMPGLVAPTALTRALQPSLCRGWAAGTAQAKAPEGTPDAVQAATDAAEVADRLGLEPVVYDLDSVRFEVQVTRPGPARDALVDILAPLAEHGDLWSTLQEYLDCEGSRGETARRLHVHVNTLDYRLGRIHTLTNVDPTQRDGWLMLRASSLALRFVLGSAGGVAAGPSALRTPGRTPLSARPGGTAR